MAFPCIHIQEIGSHIRASAGLLLCAISPVEIEANGKSLSNSMDWLRPFHLQNVRFVQILSQTLAGCTIELHVISWPSFDSSVPGRILIALSLHAFGHSRAETTEACLSHVLALEGILHTFWGQTEFRPIISRDDYAACFAPFEPEGCLVIRRKSRVISLAHPFETGTKSSVGFLPATKPDIQTEEPACRVRHVYPWVPSFDDWSMLLQSLLRNATPQHVVIRVSGSARLEETIESLESTVRICEQFLGSASADQVTLSGQIHMIRDAALQRISQLGEGALSGAVLLFSPGPPDEALAGVLGQSISGDFTRAATENPYCGGFDVAALDPVTASDSSGFFENEPLTAAEAACAFRPPLVLGDEEIGLAVRRSRTIALTMPTAPADEHLTKLGVNFHRGADRPIAISLDHRLKHVFLIGMTGTGKSTLMLSMLLQDLREGHGLCLLDPHGDLADDLLARFPKCREKALLLIDLADREYPVPLNMLHWQTLDERDLIIDEFLSALLRVYREPQMFGPIFEMNFRAMMKLLMGDCRFDDFTPTLLEFPKVYLIKEFREFLLNRSQDDQVRDFIAEIQRVRGENELANLAPYITNKLARFLQDRHLRRIVGHGAMTLNFTDLMDDRKVLIVKLARGQYGAMVADLLTSHLTARLRLAAMGRAARPKAERKPFFLYIDEFGSLPRDENFSNLLSEARKYGLGMVMATQYASQLRSAHGTADNLSAVMGNVGTVIAFRVGAEDAPMLAPVFAPTVSAQDLMECPNFQGYMRLHLSETAVRPFSFRNQPDGTPADEARSRKIVEAGRKRYGVPAEECDQRAEERRRMIAALQERG